MIRKINFLLLLISFIIIGPVMHAQSTETIYGQILDNDGYGVVGATIIEVGTSNGTQTDFDGKFTITVQENASLQISYLGFNTSIIEAKADNFNIWIFDSNGGIKIRYWCCTSHENPTHCAETKEELAENHQPDEKYERTNE